MNPFNILGDPISCINDGAIPVHVINTYCWITYTFTMPGQHGKHVGTEVAQSGLGNDNADKIYHSYYQWVPFVLFFQVSIFIITKRTFSAINSNTLIRVSCSTFHIGFGRTGKKAKFA